MSKLDWEKIGFKAGIEIHQQLEGKKLFCNCPTTIREDKPDFIVQRYLRASTGESGEVDVAASHEQKKKKSYAYQGYQDTTCLVEIDEEPVPRPNPESVKTGVMVAELFGMHRVDEVHVMRKVVVDGSNTSGFQRTMMLAYEGQAEDVRIDRICLEEDACKIVSRGSKADVYNLSRLGIPLLEITTKPDITSPEHLQSIAGYIGMVLRSTGRVKRGLGSIRQDVNISITGGVRVEIKGVQNLDLMPVIASNEAERQMGLITLAQEVSNPVLGKPVDVSKIFVSDKEWIKKSLTKGVALAVKAPGLSGYLGRELFSGYRVGTELSGYAKAWGFGGLIHSDEPAKKYGVDSWEAISKAVGVGKDDAFFVLIGEEKNILSFIDTALRARVRLLGVGVPQEVRKAEEDGSTSYLRPMPGAHRMYPETDTKPFSIRDIVVDTPELISDRIVRLRKQYSIDLGVAQQLIRLGRAGIFEEWAGQLPPVLVADILISKEKDVKKRHNVSVNIEEIIGELFYHLEQGLVSKDAVEDILLMHAKEGRIDWDSFKPLDESAVRTIIKEVIAHDKGAPLGALMGIAMKKLGGKADGKLVSKLIKEELK